MIKVGTDPDNKTKYIKLIVKDVSMLPSTCREKKINYYYTEHKGAQKNEK